MARLTRCQTRCCAPSCLRCRWMRARCAAVCRSWRDVLADASLWTVLDVSDAGGVTRERRTAALVRGAAARAAGQLRVLNLGAGTFGMSAADAAALLVVQVVAANAAALRVVTCGDN